MVEAYLAQGVRRRHRSFAGLELLRRAHERRNRPADQSLGRRAEFEDHQKSHQRSSPRNVEGHHCRLAAFEQPEAGELKRQPEYDKGEEEWGNVEVGLFREQPAHFRNGFEQLDHLLLEQASGIVSV